MTHCGKCVMQLLLVCLWCVPCVVFGAQCMRALVFDMRRILVARCGKLTLTNERRVFWGSRWKERWSEACAWGSCLHHGGCHHRQHQSHLGPGGSRHPPHGAFMSKGYVLASDSVSGDTGSPYVTFAFQICVTARPQKATGRGGAPRVLRMTPPLSHCWIRFTSFPVAWHRNESEARITVIFIFWQMQFYSRKL